MRYMLDNFYVVLSPDLCNRFWPVFEFGTEFHFIILDKLSSRTRWEKKKGFRFVVWRVASIQWKERPGNLSELFFGSHEPTNYLLSNKSFTTETEAFLEWISMCSWRIKVSNKWVLVIDFIHFHWNNKCLHVSIIICRYYWIFNHHLPCKGLLFYFTKRSARLKSLVLLVICHFSSDLVSKFFSALSNYIS